MVNTRMEAREGNLGEAVLVAGERDALVFLSVPPTEERLEGVDEYGLECIATVLGVKPRGVSSRGVLISCIMGARRASSGGVGAGVSEPPPTPLDARIERSGAGEHHTPC